MRPWYRALLAAVLTLLVSSPSHAAAHKSDHPEWMAPLAPFRIADNLYYVGSRDLASYLIVTPAGDILISAQHLYGLISEILDYSKIDSGTVQLVETPIDVGAMCKHCIHMVGERARSKALERKSLHRPAQPLR